MSDPDKLPKGLFILEGISFVSFNKDFTQVALSKKDNFIYIYSIVDFMNTDKWKLLYKLDAHYQYISGLDWSHESNRLLSCSYDKTSFVWDFINKNWEPSNVVVTTKLGYLCCKWNKRGDKFCEGTSAKHLLIGYFNKEQNWWNGKNIKAHKSSVVACEIDPTSLFVLSGSTDLRVYISSCYIPEVDDQYLTEETKPFARDFGQIIYEVKPNCWVNSVSWSPSGNYGLVAGQDSTIILVNFKEVNNDIIRCKHTPVTNIIPIDENSFYAACYDRNILEYEKKEGEWTITKVITDQNKEDTEDNNNEEKESGNKKSKLVVSTKQEKHLHKSQISSINIKGKDMITTDLSGFVKYWKL